MDELSRDLVIDPLQLDVECLRQVKNFYKWADRLGEARAAVEWMKRCLDKRESELQLQCRESPEDFGLEKATETAIKAAVLRSDQYQKVWKIWWDQKKITLQAQHAVSAMEMKKRMLEQLITLHGQQYFAGPSTPRNLGKKWLSFNAGSHQKKANAKVKVRRRKKKRVKK